MPEISISIENLSKAIKKLSKDEVETLLLILSDEDNELSSRIDDIKHKKVDTLSREDIFDV
jgi:succinate dehydrogenase flavin-adding protein (antitoxin of CptAB toxin-antitoxin module)